MNVWKRWTALAAAVALSLIVLSGCAGEGADVSLAVCAGSTPEDLDPIYATQTGDQTILVHLYENLMRKTVDVSGGTTVTNGLAKSVEQEDNYDGTYTWTFRLRSARWSDGRRVRADDFVYAWQRLADPANASPYADMLSVVVGYDQVQETGDVSLLQVSAENDTTLVVVLNGKYDWFLDEVCTATATLPVRQDVIEAWETAAAAQEAAAEEQESGEAGPAETVEPWWADLEGLVTNGPYTVEDHTDGGSLTVTAFEDYHSAVGPSQIVFRFADTAEEAWALYEQKEVDFVWELPQEQLEAAAEDEAAALTTELGTYAVLYRSDETILADPAVRRAMALAIDRNAVAAAAGATARPAEGLVPPGVPGGEGEGDFRTDNALLDNEPAHFQERCQEARQILTEAGYQGQELGELEYLYADIGNDQAVAQVLADTWREVLGITVTPRGVTEEELQAALESGTYTLVGVQLSAMGNDAECFLLPWSSQSGESITGYENSAYDTLMAVIASASDAAARMGCLHDAEVLLLEDSALSPLYTTVTDWELRDTLTGLCRDARGWFSFSGVTHRST